MLTTVYTVLSRVSYPLVGFVTRRFQRSHLNEIYKMKSAGHKSNQRVRNAQEYLIVSILNQFKAQKGHVRVWRPYELDTKSKKHMKGLDKLNKTH